MAFLLSAIGQGLTLGLQVLFARLSGAEEYGIYSYTMAWLGVGLIIGKLGFDTALVRFSASYSSREKPGLAVGVWLVARRWSLASSIIAAPVLAAAAWFAARSGGVSLVCALLVFVLLLPVAVVGELASAALRGFKRIGAAMLGDSILRPIVAMVVFGLFAAFGQRTAGSTMAAYGIGTVVATGVTVMFLRRAHRVADAETPSRRLARAWVTSAMTLMLANAFLILLYTVDTILIGALRGTTEAGMYSVASRIALLVLFVMNALQAIGGPLISESYSAGERQELRRVIRLLNLCSVIAALPVVAVLALWPDKLLGLFGDEFSTAADVLRILALMQLLNVLTGPVGLLMSMTGRQRTLAILLGGAFLVHVALCVVLVPQSGAMGAAWAAFIAHGLWNLAGVFIVRAALGVDCSLVDWVRWRSVPVRAA